MDPRAVPTQTQSTTQSTSTSTSTSQSNSQSQSTRPSTRQSNTHSTAKYNDNDHDISNTPPASPWPLPVNTVDASSTSATTTTTTTTTTATASTATASTASSSSISIPASSPPLPPLPPLSSLSGHRRSIATTIASSTISHSSASSQPHQTHPYSQSQLQTRDRSTFEDGPPLHAAAALSSLPRPPSERAAPVTGLRRKPGAPLSTSTVTSPTAPSFAANQHPSTSNTAVYHPPASSAVQHPPASFAVQHPPSTAPLLTPPLPSPGSPPILVRNLDQYPRGASPYTPQGGFTSVRASTAGDPNAIAAATHVRTAPPLESVPVRVSVVESRPRHPAAQPPEAPMATVRSNGAAGPGGIHIVPPSDNNGRHSPLYDNGPLTPNGKHSTTTKLSTFFGWKGNPGHHSTSPNADISPTTFSDRSSPVPSPPTTSLTSLQSAPKHLGHLLPAGIDVPRANGLNGYTQAVQGRRTPSLGPAMPFPPVRPGSAGLTRQIEELEGELREITMELAGSIRREMELEDEIDRLQLESTSTPEGERRTSDYYSDSGASGSVRDPDAPTSKQGVISEVEALRRKSEKEKAQLRLDAANKVHEERTRRKAVEDQVRTLENRIHRMEEENDHEAPARVQELHEALEEGRRRLAEEKKQNQNYEDLIAALRIELVNTQNDCENLREETVPQLQARVDGLEAEAVEVQRLTYENTRMQQELYAFRMGHGAAFMADESRDMISPIGGAPMTPRVGLSRSTSLMRNSGSGQVGNRLMRSDSLSRTGHESSTGLEGRIKDIEEQRDALHRALRSLIERQRWEAREHDRRLRQVELERDRATEMASPRRRGYEDEVKLLRTEINELRSRADEALEQKWQCEKGLSGLKMDLDRAEQETSDLRQLLTENDILIPPDRAQLSPSTRGRLASTDVTSASLEKAYQDLRQAQARTMSRLQALKAGQPAPGAQGQDGSDGPATPTTTTMNLLMESMSQTDTYRAEVASLNNASAFQASERADLAKQLQASATRAETLASQVTRQLDANRALRARLAAAVGTGEREQTRNTTRINELQSKLRQLEEQLVQAQSQSEEGLAGHEDEVRSLRGSDSTRLQRLKPGSSPLRPASGSQTPASRSSHPLARQLGGASPQLANIGSPRSPLRSPAMLPSAVRSPRLDQTSSGTGQGLSESLRTEALERRVRQLEHALLDAEQEMGEVVQRMNAAQIEVMELQGARDDAIKQTRTLQSQVLAENAKVGSLLDYLPRGHRLPSLSAGFSSLSGAVPATAQTAN